ncbi:MAG: translational GTPase TypA [Planctomycetales bacterium]|nr:translational GTPase TypA [Planctomycetales bacterium]MBN8625699.1 translational GTPase TypA [Planctomycetota bacterium]
MSSAELSPPAKAATGRRRDDVRNLAIIAHVDHGKTTLVDVLLKESGEFRASELTETCILDSNDLEKERGITILAKNVAMHYKGVKINLIDTPGHADFGGEVERVLRMADGCLMLVDAAEGPMPQTRFVLSKAIEFGLKPIVVINKIDRADARCNEVLNEVFELFLELGADDDLADFPYIYAAGRQGYATTDPNVPTDSIRPLLDLVLEHIPGPIVDEEAPLQMLVTTLDWSQFVGRIAIGRIASGTVKQGQRIMLMQKDDKQKPGKIIAIQAFEKLARVEVPEAGAGDVVAIVGLEDVEIGDTISDFDNPQRLERVQVDQPTLEMTFSVNSSPFAGKSGKFLTTRHIRDRLMRELERNVALKVRQLENSDSYAVAGRGLLHLSVLIETMRREGYELSIGKPKVINKELNGVLHEPFETLVVEVPPEKLGKVMELVGARRGQMVEMAHRGNYAYVSFSIPARGLIGLRTRILNATQGEGIMHHRFEGYKPLEGEVPSRANGVLVSMVSGKAFAFGLDGLQDRADLFIAPGAEIYEGMIVGENSRDNDMTVNPCREKKLTNMRASGTDDNVILKPPRQITLETALEYIEDDELVEVTPDAIRLRKILLTENDRKRAGRAAAK